MSRKLLLKSGSVRDGWESSIQICADAKVISKIYTFLVLLLNTKIKLSLSLLMLFHLCKILIPQWLNWNFRDRKVMSPLDAHN